MSAAFDRGPAKHFHGRKKILGDFDGLLKHYSNNATGGTFLIQGAPGAGKTALLSECGRRAQEAGWRIARVPGLSALWRPSALHSSLYSGKSLLDGRVIDRSAGSVLEMLRGGVGPLLLKLDEA
ncbi:MAG: ATP-binding protein, partial [Bacteroidetes bacterium]|nr:ATP-binding protein [Bacteroidota bacterium]